MGKGTQLNCGVHEQTNTGPVRKFKAVHILMQNGERILPLLVRMWCWQVVCKRAIRWDAKNKAPPADCSETEFPT